MAVVYQKAFDHIDANSKPMQFLDKHILHHDHTPQSETTSRPSPLAMHIVQPNPAPQLPTAKQIPSSQTNPIANQSYASVQPSQMQQNPLAQSMPPPFSNLSTAATTNVTSAPNTTNVTSASNNNVTAPPFRGGLSQFVTGAGNAAPSPLQRLSAAQPLAANSSSTGSSTLQPAAVVPTGHGVSSWIQQQPSAAVPIVTQSVVNAAVPTMSAHHASATPSAKIVIPLQQTATAFTTQPLKPEIVANEDSGKLQSTAEARSGGLEVPHVWKSAAEAAGEARSGSTGAPQILKKHKKKHTKKVKARPSTCGCC